VNQKTFIFFALVFCGAAFYHFVSVFYPLNSAPPWRNIVFIFINLFGAWGIIKRPPWFIYFFFAWMIQQMISHGGSILTMWRTANKFDWLSAFTVLLMILVFIALVRERNLRSPTARNFRQRG
jgi:hypothetical protein